MKKERKKKILKIETMIRLLWENAYKFNLIHFQEYFNALLDDIQRLISNRFCTVKFGKNRYFRRAIPLRCMGIGVCCKVWRSISYYFFVRMGEGGGLGFAESDSFRSEKYSLRIKKTFYTDTHVVWSFFGFPKFVRKENRTSLLGT